MWFWMILLGTVLLVYLLLKPSANRNGGSIDSFIREVQDDGSEAEVNESDPYKKVFLGPGKQVLVFYGTEYGFSEQVAKKLYDEILKIEVMQPRLVNMAHFKEIDLAQEQIVFLICSTSGDGVPPTDARPFHEWIGSERINLSHLYFSTLALGDSAYPHFCRAGLSLHETFLGLSARLSCEMATVDLEDWDVINRWTEGALATLKTLPLEPRDDYLDLASIGNESQGPSRKQPFFGTLVAKYALTSSAVGGEEEEEEEKEEKEVIHCEFDLRGSGLSYSSGDALGLFPLNHPDHVAALLSFLRPSALFPSTLVSVPSSYAPAPQGNRLPLEEALLKYFDLKTVRPELLRYLTETATNQEEKQKGTALLLLGLSPKENPPLAEYLKEREVADVLEDFPSSQLEGPTFLSLLRQLQPRYYSISSSPAFSNPQTLSITVAVLRYVSLGKPRTGVCSTFLADRMKIGQSCPLFISKNPEFRQPRNSSTPMIMVGPGTGIAPFRAFLQDRLLLAPMLAANNLLYFGCRFSALDFLYKDELSALEAEGKLTLRVAFSREQKPKMYVQHLILQDSAKIWDLIQVGAHIYICGDARCMARDVQETFLRIFRKEGKMGEEEASRFLASLEASHRFQRDVWIT